MAKVALDTRAAYGEDQIRRLESDIRVIHVERAKRDYSMAEDFRYRRLYTSAKYYYRLVMKDYADTDWARKAEERLLELGDRETKHFKPSKFFAYPFSTKSKIRPAFNPFDRKASENDVERNSTLADENKQMLPGENENSLSKEAEAESIEQSQPASDKKPLWGMRNWLEQL